MIFQIRNYIVDIDVDSTRRFYQKYKPINNCKCSGCTNYRKYMKRCNQTIKDTFSSFGIDDLSYIIEIIPFVTTLESMQQNGGIPYGGFYHVNGTIINQFAKHSSLEIASQFKIFLNDRKEIAPQFEIFLNDRNDLVDPKFPKPILQIEIYAHIPWILFKPNDYLIS